MTRTELAKSLARLVVVNNLYYTIGLLFNSHEELKEFRTLFRDYINEVPTWLKPEVSHDQERLFRYSSGEIRFALSTRALSGVTLNSLYISREVDMELPVVFETLMPCLNATNANVGYFD